MRAREYICVSVDLCMYLRTQLVSVCLEYKVVCVPKINGLLRSTFWLRLTLEIRPHITCLSSLGQNNNPLCVSCQIIGKPFFWIWDFPCGWFFLSFLSFHERTFFTEMIYSWLFYKALQRGYFLLDSFFRIVSIFTKIKTKSFLKFLMHIACFFQLGGYFYSLFLILHLIV